MRLKVYRQHQNMSQNGRCYSMHLHTPDGEVLVDHACDPEHGAARALVTRGNTGPFTVYVPSALRSGTWIASLHFKSAEAAANYSTVEENRRGLKVVRHRPGPAARAPIGVAEALSMASSSI